MDLYFSACYTVTIITLLTSLTRVNSFNLDIDHPIIYEGESYTTKSGYFGYSVGMYTVSNESWILIGAPKANFSEYSSIKEPGLVYQCPLSSLGNCEPINLISDGGYNIPYNYSHYDPEEEDSEKAYPDNGFMGGSMVIQEGPKGRLAICGQKTGFNVQTGESKILGRLGYCLWKYLDGDDFHPITPFIQSSLESGPAKTSPLGAAGFSIAMTELREETDLRRLFFGVPGFENHQGAVSLIRDKNTTNKENARQRRAIDPNDFGEFLGFHPYQTLKTQVKGYELFGYQVAIGFKAKKSENSKRLFFLASAPRANGLKGMVFHFYIIKKEKINTLVKEKEYHGLQVGEYYGASLATGDLNNDGSDDIIIGAPFYANEENGKRNAFDEGRVEVIIMKEKIQLIGKATGGRFGYAVSFLGVLCPNEPPKIGVAAPNEDEGRGVVYIYSYNDGSFVETQRLVARHIYHKLKGFGSYIITHPSDIDANEVYDIAVGAYKSGHAVVLRGKPVLKWHTRLLPKSDTISLNSTTFTFSSCISFEGVDYIEKVAVYRVLHLDPGYQRCHLNGKKNDSAVIIVQRRKENCENFTVTFEENIKDFEPLVVGVSFSLKEEKRNKSSVVISGAEVIGHDEFCKNCPMTRPISPLERKYPFAHDCGDDNICWSDLIIDGNFPELQDPSNGYDAPFIVGSQQGLGLKVSVRNKKDAEKSYKPYITLLLPSGIDVKQFYHSECEKVDSPEGCNFHNEASDQIYIRCDVSAELAPSKEEAVEISLDLTYLNGSAAENITVCAASASKEANDADNMKIVPVHFQYNADIAITGVAEIEQFDFMDQKATEGSMIDVNHVYEVQKFGVSPVAEVETEILVPYAIEDDDGSFIEFLKLKYEGTQNGESLPCSSLFMDDERPSLRRKRSVDEDDISEDNLKNITAAQAPSNRTLYLNCSASSGSDHPKIRCIRVNCSSLPLQHDLDVATVELFMTLDTESLKKAKKEKDLILLETLGSIQVLKPKVLNHGEKNSPKQMWISTLFIGDIPAGKVAIWIIILAIIVGILLLALLGFGLYKAGFFKRKKREELDSLKHQITTNEEFSEESTENMT